MENFHLSDQNIAEAAEALNRNEYLSLDKKIREHLSTCSTCHAELMAVSTLTDFTDESVEDEDVTEHISLPVRSRWKHRFLAVASVACAVLVFSALYLNTEHSDELFEGTVADVIVPELIPVAPVVIKPQQKESAILLESDEKLVEEVKQITVDEVKNDQQLLAFIPNDRLERVVNRFEGSNSRSQGLNVKSTSVVAGTVGDIVLQWEDAMTEPLSLELFDNTGKSLAVVDVTHNTYKPDLKLPGLYYWKMYNEEFDLLFCGKINISE